MYFWISHLFLLTHLSSSFWALIVRIAWRLNNSELVLNESKLRLRLLPLRVYKLLWFLSTKLVLRLLIKLHWNILRAFNSSVWKFLALELKSLLLNIIICILTPTKLAFNFLLGLILWILELVHFHLVLLKLLLDLLNTVLLKGHTIHSYWCRWCNLLLLELLLLRSFVDILNTTFIQSLLRGHRNRWVMRTHSFIVLNLLTGRINFICSDLLNILRSSPVLLLGICLEHLHPLLILDLIWLYLWLELIVHLLVWNLLHFLLLRLLNLLLLLYLLANDGVCLLLLLWFVQFIYHWRLLLICSFLLLFIAGRLLIRSALIDNRLLLYLLLLLNKPLGLLLLDTTPLLHILVILRLLNAWGSDLHLLLRLHLWLYLLILRELLLRRCLHLLFLSKLSWNLAILLELICSYWVNLWFLFFLLLLWLLFLLALEVL